MARRTIDFGIDLGTTNSEVAVIEGIDVHVFKNNFNEEWTPSAIYLDGRGRLFVGRRAKERAEHDPENVRVEFKRDMGTPVTYTFVQSGHVMSPEACSAEVLKSLVDDVRQRTEEEVNTAVITVPAMFELPACEATQRAAKLAGIEFAPLLQEPIAAAIAYGFQADADNAFWLVYDLGGGTFDASLVAVREGRLTVVDHDGENHLGGKDFDWLLVEGIVVPHLQQQYALATLRRSNVHYHTALAKLKAACEKAKIELSRRSSALIQCEELCEDEVGTVVEVDLEVTQEAYSRLIAPLVERTISICRRVLQRNNLSAQAVARVALVGGPTLAPFLREALQSALGIPLDFRVDPITAVARGAAVFAGSQPRAAGQTKAPAAPGQGTVELSYQPITPDPEPFVGGKVLVGGTAPGTEYRVELVRGDGGWRSGLLPLNATGAFFANVRLLERRPNEFQLEVRDGQGRSVDVSPNRFTITHGMGVDNPPLARSLGVGLANGIVSVYLPKGTPLPGRGRNTHQTAKPVSRGQGGALLTIPVVEGEYRLMSRNRKVGELSIPGTELKRDLRAGADVEVTLRVDTSRAVEVVAYIPELDQEFAGKIAFESEVPSSEVLSEELTAQRDRLRAARTAQRDVPDADAEQRVGHTLREIQDQGAVEEIERLVEAAQGGENDAAKAAAERLKELAAKLDETEGFLEWPTLEQQAVQALQETRDVVDRLGDQTQKADLQTLEAEVRAAIRAKDPEAVRAKVDDLIGLRVRAQLNDPGFWVGWFQYLQEKPLTSYTDRVTTERLLRQGAEALNRNDLDGLKSVVRQLVRLLSPEESAELDPSLSGLI